MKDRSVLEVGSQNVNGSPRTVIEPLKPSRYVGVDFAPGPGVDLVRNAEELPGDLGQFNVVVSTEMLEHVRDWKKVVSAIKKSVSPGGFLFITTRSPGFQYHGYPNDYWRFSIEDFHRIFSDLWIINLARDPLYPGVFLKARKPPSFEEADLSRIEVSPAPPPP